MKKKLTIEDLKEAARLKGGICLAVEYMGPRVKHPFRCGVGHEFSMRTDGVRARHWCNECNKGTIKEIAKIVEAKGGRVISENYVNARIPIEVECKMKHRWFARPYALKGGQWCKDCADTRLKIEEMQEIAAVHGGKCLSLVYVNAWTKLEWECDQGHIWMAPAKEIKYKKTWCPHCRKVDLNEIQELAIKNGGTCISSEIRGNTATAVLKFICGNGHNFTLTPADLKYHKRWCKKCKIDERYAELKAAVEKKGGKVISTKYRGANVKLKFRCEEGHIFYTTPSKILNAGHWCNVCTKYITQEKCRFLFQKLLGCEFVKTKKPLKKYELDGYNEGMGLAFEYNGPQHYVNNRKFYKSNEELEKRIEMDLLKKDLCREFPIKLVVIPCFEVTVDGSYDGIVDNDKLKKFILVKLDEFEIAYNDLPIDFTEFHECLSELKKIKKIAKDKGGECVSKTYVNNRTHLEFICDKDHSWLARPHAIARGTWCPVCGRVTAINSMREKSLALARKIAVERGGQCLVDAKTYINHHTPIEWESAEGQRWFASLANVKSGTWCPHAARPKHLTEDKRS